MKKWRVFLLALGIAVISVIAGYQFQQYQERKRMNVVGQKVTFKTIAPEKVIGTKLTGFNLSDVNGQQRYISEWEGKIRVLNFWATWCAPCRDEIPVFVDLQNQYQNEGLQFIGIALQKAEEIRDFLQEFDVNYPALVGADDVIDIAKSLGNDIGALPYTVFINRDGIIAVTHRGPLRKTEAEKIIRTLL